METKLHRCSRQLPVYAPQMLPHIKAEVSARCRTSAGRIAAAARRSPPAVSRVQGTRGASPERLHASFLFLRCRAGSCRPRSGRSADESPTFRKQKLHFLQQRTHQSLYWLVNMTSRQASRAAHTQAGARQRVAPSRCAQDSPAGLDEPSSPSSSSWVEAPEVQ